VDALLTALGIKKGVLIAGAFGGLISFKFFTTLAGWERAFTCLLGLPAAWYVGPGLAKYFQLTSDEAELAIVCLTGALGITVLSRLVEAIPELFRTGLDYLKGKLK